MMKSNNRDFKGVWIPKQIWLDNNLGWSEKLLLVEIESLDNEKGCFASNEYLGGFFGLSKDRISKMISSLKDKGYLEVQLIYYPGTKNIEKRIISIDKLKFHGIDTYRRKQLEGIGENTDTPIGENTEDNNTLINNTINKTLNTIRPKFSTFDLQASERLYELMLINNPSAKKPNFETWAKEVRLMREMDNRTEEQIMYVIEWSQKDTFWYKNILSTSKLRKQFDKLVMVIKDEASRNGKQQSNKQSTLGALQNIVNGGQYDDRTINSGSNSENRFLLP